MRPTFVVSIDEELVWGSFDHTSVGDFARRYPDLRGVVEDLLALFDRYEVPVTWAMVGHLFLDSCARAVDGRAHPELRRPRYAWFRGDWFRDDPCSDRERDPLWYGDDLVAMIRQSRTKHELASHSFSHLVYGDPGCSADVVEDDLSACVAAARSRGVELRSFVFPRNVEGHHALLARHGFTAYRGVDQTWFRGFPAVVRRLLHLIDQGLAMTPPVSLPLETLPGLWNVPGSMIFLPRDGFRRVVPLASRIRKAKAGLNAAVRLKRIFHLWFHPFNFAVDRRALLGALDSILQCAADLRDRGDIEIRTMNEVAAYAATATSTDYA